MSVSPALTPIDDVLALMLSKAKAVQQTHQVSLNDALGFTLADDIASRINVPPNDNSAMDGYAVRSVDLMDNKTLKVTQRIPAGSIGELVEQGTAARIFTGAAIPELADAVIIQEDTELNGDLLTVNCEQVRPGQNIRPAGQDIARNQIVLEAGTKLAPQHIGLLASIGVAEVEVFKPITVAVLSTGEELVEPGDRLAPGQIYNSNRYMLVALAKQLGCRVIDKGIVGDNLAATVAALSALAEQADVIISTGGVSVGEEDHVKAAVEQLGHIDVWKLNIKPGKPVVFGQVHDTAFIGLPGNPSSAFVTFALLARPYLLKRMGCAQTAPLLLQAVADFETKKPGKRQEYFRAKLIREEGGLVVWPHPNQSSGILSSVAWANALVVIPPGVQVNKGDVLDVLLIDDLVN